MTVTAFISNEQLLPTLISNYRDSGLNQDQLTYIFLQNQVLDNESDDTTSLLLDNGVVLPLTQPANDSHIASISNWFNDHSAVFDSNLPYYNSTVAYDNGEEVNPEVISRLRENLGFGTSSLLLTPTATNLILFWNADKY